MDPQRQRQVMDVLQEVLFGQSVGNNGDDAAAYIPVTYHDPICPPQRWPGYEISVHTDIGNRRTQEDRFCFCPKLVEGRDDCAFFGVFDGTVGDFASDNVMHLVVPHLTRSEPWKRAEKLLRLRPGKKVVAGEAAADAARSMGIMSSSSTTASSSTMKQPSSEGVTTASTATVHSMGSESDTALRDLRPAAEDGAQSSQGGSTPAAAPGKVIANEVELNEEEYQQALDRFLPDLLKSAMEAMYQCADEELIVMCEHEKKHYASSTSVTLLMAGGFCCVGHLGDSRIAMGYEDNGDVFGEFLTNDHKPNLPEEKARIMANGGSVEYLHNHNNKPFIRGGDFTIRKSNGEQPMQLQYSRAFGGKDLKMFGLSNQPDVLVFKLKPSHKVFLLASDGLWDVHSAPFAVKVAMVARGRGENPATSLVNVTLLDQRLKKQNADNITAMVIFLQPSFTAIDASARRDGQGDGGSEAAEGGGLIEERT